MGSKGRIIFLTMSREHTLDAFGVEASQYLVKPISEQMLFPVLDKLLEDMGKRAGNICCCALRERYFGYYCDENEVFLLLILGKLVFPFRVLCPQMSLLSFSMLFCGMMFRRESRNRLSAAFDIFRHTGKGSRSTCPGESSV